MRTLHLSVTKLPFEVMITREKQTEFRKPSKWIKSRLFDKQGKKRKYDFVKITNGYGPDKPYFIADFLGIYEQILSTVLEYSNGLNVELESGDYKIMLGPIIEIGNIKKDLMDKIAEMLDIYTQKGWTYMSDGFQLKK